MSSGTIIHTELAPPRAIPIATTTGMPITVPETTIPLATVVAA